MLCPAAPKRVTGRRGELIVLEPTAFVASVLGWIQPALGFVSASLVAIIALGFGALFVFFSGASALVMGQFVSFARSPRVAFTAIAVAALAWGVAAWIVGAEPILQLPILQLIFGALAYGLLRTGVSLRVVLVGIGLLLLIGGASFALGLLVPSLEPIAFWGQLLASLCLQGGALGLAPLVVAGLVRHRFERPVEWFISLRYLVARRRQTFISIISVICVTGVALGVAVITVVLSVMNGFSQVWEDKILGTRAHFVLQSREGPYGDYQSAREALLRVPGVTGATPVIETEAILRGGGGELEAILLKGIDPATIGEATQLPQTMIDGSLEALDDPPRRSRESNAEAALDPDAGSADEEPAGSADYPGIVIGVELADRYFLRTGDPIILISPMGGPSTPLGPAPRMARFRIAGIFKSEFFEFDQRFAYASLADVQKFMKIPDVVDGIEVRTVDPYRSNAIGMQAEEELGGLFFARDWKTFYPGFFSALKMERAMMFVLLSFIMVVAGFIIIATLIMMIMEKSRDIAILKAMGCEDEGVLRVFAIQGFLIGLGGLGLGLAMGLIITWNLDVIQGAVEQLLGIDVLPRNVYQLQQLPYHVVPGHLVLISLIAMVLSVGATLLPSWQAARLDPAEALRFE